MGSKTIFFSKKMKLLASLGLTLVSAGTFPVRVPCSSQDSCQKICAASHKCKFWTFWAGKCWLKAQEGWQMDENSNAVSGDKSGETIWEGISLGHGEAMTNKQSALNAKLMFTNLMSVNKFVFTQTAANSGGNTAGDAICITPKVGRWPTIMGSIQEALTEIWTGKTSPYKEELSKLSIAANC